MQENDQRSALSLADSIRAVARYQALDPKASATKIAKRVGHTPAWVKARLAVAVLPADVLDLLNDGTLTLPWVTAIATLADLGDDAVRACAEQARTRRWGEPDDTVAGWRRRRQSEEHRDKLAAELVAKGMTVQHDVGALREAKAVQTTGYHGSLGLDRDQARQHRLEPCHVFCLRVDSWSDKVEVSEWCNDPKRHKATKTRAASSKLVVANPDNRTPRSEHAEQKARRAARAARIEAAVAMFAGRPPKQATVIELAAHAVLLRMGSDDSKLAASWLGIDADPKAWDHTSRLRTWLTDGGDPARLLLAVAGAEHETHGSASHGLPTHGGKAAGSRAWLTALARHGGHTTCDDDFEATAATQDPTEDDSDPEPDGDDPEDDTTVD